MPKARADSEHSSDECLTSDILLDFATEKMSEDESARTKAHLEWCTICQEEVEEIRQFLEQDIIETCGKLSGCGARKTGGCPAPFALLLSE